MNNKVHIKKLQRGKSTYSTVELIVLYEEDALNDEGHVKKNSFPVIFVVVRNVEKVRKENI